MRPRDYFAISAYAFALSVLWNSLGPIILPILVLQYVPEALKNTSLSVLTFTGMILAIFIQPAAGALSDRSIHPQGRRRPFMALGVAGSFIFLLLIGASNSFIWLLLAYAGLQILSNIAQGPYQALIPDLVPEHRRGVASGAKNLAEILGIITCTLLAGALMDNYSRTGQSLWLWLAVGGIGVILLAALGITWLGVREVPAAEVDPQSLWKSVIGTFSLDLRQRDRVFAWFLISRLFFLMAMTSVQSFALYFVRDVIQVPDPASTTAFLLAVIAILVMLVVYPTGFLADRIGRRPLIAISGLVGATGTALMILAHNQLQVLLFGGLIGIGIGVFLSSNWALATDLIPLDQAARYLGLTNLATAGGAALARLGGPVIDIFNAQQSGLGYQVLFGMCVVYWLLGTALLAKVPEGRARLKDRSATG